MSRSGARNAVSVSGVDVAEVDIAVNIISFKINIFDYIVQYDYSFI